MLTSHSGVSIASPEPKDELLYLLNFRNGSVAGD